MKKQLKDLKVIRNRRLDAEHFILVLRSFDDLPEIHPGQFVEVLVEGSPATFLRRPFSIQDYDAKEKTISLFIKRVGDGSDQLAYLEEGDFLNVMFPLGNWFSQPQTERVLLVGGGFGMAPLLCFAKELSKKGIYPNILLAGRSKNLIHEIEEYEKYGKVFISTNDGSLGEQGLVTEHSFFAAAEYDQIYTCGPEPMMKAVAAFAREKKIPCEVSLENMMACGFGVCLCCVTETTTGNKCVCTEGPVFNINDLKW